MYVLNAINSCGVSVSTKVHLNYTKARRKTTRIGRVASVLGKIKDSRLLHPQKERAMKRNIVETCKTMMQRRHMGVMYFTVSYGE